MNRYLLPLLVFVCLIALFVKGLDPERDLNALPSPLIGKAAPEINLPNLKDTSIRVNLKEYIGQVTLVNVWATWCVGCRQEHQFLLELEETNTLPIFGLNWRDRERDAIEWLEVLGDPYVGSAFDQDGRIGINWGVYGAPESFLINSEGIIIHKHLGPLNWSIWQKDFSPLISQVRNY